MGVPISGLNKKSHFNRHRYRGGYRVQLLFLLNLPRLLLRKCRLRTERQQTEMSFCSC